MLTWHGAYMTDHAAIMRSLLKNNEGKFSPYWDLNHGPLEL